MTKVGKKTEKTRVSSPKALPGDTTKPSRIAPLDAAGSTRGTSNRDDWVQMSFRAPPAVEEFVMTMCVKRRITLQTLILALLRDLGAPVRDADLRDNRKGRKASRLNGAASQALKSMPFTKYRGGITALEQLRDPHLREQIAQQGNRQAIGQLPGTLQIVFANIVGDKAR